MALDILASSSFLLHKMEGDSYAPKPILPQLGRQPVPPARILTDRPLKLENLQFSPFNSPTKKNSIPLPPDLIQKAKKKTSKHNSLSSSSSSSSETEDFFECPHQSCKRQFTHKRNLVDHFRGHHQGTKPHVCTFHGCTKSFLRPAHLLIHYRIHTGEKPFKCEYPGCGKKWNQKSALKQHMRSHTGEKPFECSYNGCNKRFSTSSSCKRHISTHERPGSPKRMSLSPKSTDSMEGFNQLCKSLESQMIEDKMEVVKKESKFEEDNKKMTLRFIVN